MYIQNKNLKSEKSKVESNLSATKFSYDKKISDANKKIQILTLFFSGLDNQDSSLEAYRILKEINDETLLADYKAMQNSKPGDTSGDKMLKDLAAAIANDLK